MAAAGADDFSIVVDPVAFGVPDYWAYVHRPMDLGTVRANVVKGAYSAPWQVDAFSPPQLVVQWLASAAQLNQLSSVKPVAE